MGAPRRDIINYDVTTTYHIICTCVQQDALLGSRSRKQMVLDKLRHLQSMFFISVLKYAIMSNHLHLVLRASPECTADLSDEQLMRLWAVIHPPLDRNNRPLEVSDEWIRRRAGNAKLVAATREKLSSISQFMKELNQSIAQRANREDGRKGHFWARRFKSVALLDEAAILAVGAYVDLNPLRAGVCKSPEEAEFTTLSVRIQATRNHSDVRTADASTWVVPIGRHADRASYTDPKRVGMFKDLILYDYLTIVDQAARLPKQGKAHLGDTASPIFSRLKLDEATYTSMMRRLNGNLRGYLLGEEANVAQARRQLKAASAAR
jgi:hypothetical protein